VEDCFETFVQVYDEHYSRQYGFWQPYLENVIYRYLDCGDPYNGLARIKCKDCGQGLLPESVRSDFTEGMQELKC